MTDSTLEDTSTVFEVVDLTDEDLAGVVGGLIPGGPITLPIALPGMV